jgi:DNA-binding response OmpR family regulator
MEEQFLETKAEELTPRLYLAWRLISSQGGDFAIRKVAEEQLPGYWIEVTFHQVSEQEPEPILKREFASRELSSGRILVADAQPEYQALFRKQLGERGYRVDLASNGSAALDMVQVMNPDLVVVDRHLPGLDGILVTQGIRRWSSVPIIMISSTADADDLVHAFQIGVDDYLAKPFLVDEILARIVANLRRGKDSSQAFTPEVFQAGDVRINYSTRQVWLRGRPVDLTPTEYNLLSYMSRHQKQIMAYEQLIERAWEGPDKGTRQGLFVHIRRLRKKIELDPDHPQIIQNKWGVGYIFSP